MYAIFTQRLAIVIRHCCNRLSVDPDCPSYNEAPGREFHHWLVGNIPGKDVCRGETLTAFVGSCPPLSTGNNNSCVGKPTDIFLDIIDRNNNNNKYLLTIL